jgi:hypothetical protein
VRIDSKIFKTSLGEDISKILSKSPTIPLSQLHLSDEDDWKRWLRSPNFKPFWNALWEDCLKKNEKTSRGVGLEETLNVMQAFKEETVNPYTDTSDWTEVHYLARFMYHALRHNTRHLDGLYKNRALRPREAEILMWSVLKAIQHLHAPSQINRPSGGRALLDDSFIPKVSRKRTARNIPRTKKKRLKKDAEQNPFSNGPREEKYPILEHNKMISQSWKTMIKSYGREEHSIKKSPKFDLADPYWQLMFARTAIQRAEIDKAGGVIQ